MKVNVKILCILGSFGLSACTSDTETIYTQRHAKTLALTSLSGFKTSKHAEHLQHTDVEQHTLDLAKRFAHEAPTRVNFAFNSAALDDAARKILRAQAQWINHFPEVRFRIYGHTDLVGGSKYNNRLGQKRAKMVMRYLIHRGIERSRLEISEPLGETQPLTISQTRDPQNRRTVTEVAGFMKTHPNIIDGKYTDILAREFITGTSVTP